MIKSAAKFADSDNLACFDNRNIEVARELFRIGFSYDAALAIFFDNAAGSLQFVEYNAESPAGMAYEDELSDVFLDELRQGGHVMRRAGRFD